MDLRIMKELFNLVISKYNRATRRLLKMPKELLLVDSLPL
jgi:hypothetical protein